MKKENGILAFDYMRKYKINVGRNDVWHYIKFLLDKKLNFVIPLFCFYCKHIKFNNKFLNTLFWDKNFSAILWKFKVLK